jgi:hypothetical protein
MMLSLPEENRSAFALSATVIEWSAGHNAREISESKENIVFAM